MAGDAYENTCRQQEGASMATEMKITTEHGKMPVNSRLLDLFWELAEGEDQIRIQATEKMISVLTEKQKNGTVQCKELEYAIKRLVKGLASSRKLARIGFVTTLCQVLRKFPIVTTSIVLDKMKSELQITRHEQKSDQSNIILGRVMCYLALIQAGTLFSSTGAEIGNVAKHLVRIQKKKVPIHQLCVQAICQIVAKVSSETFSASVWPHLEAEVSGGWEGCSPDTLLLLLTINKHHTSVVGKEFLSAHWKCKKIIAEKNFELIKDVMKQSTVDHPLIHAVCPELVKRAMASPNLFSAFWTGVVSDKLITQKMERRYLGFQLVVVALQNASTSEQVNIILTETIVQAIVTNLSHKDRPLHAPVKKLCENLQSFVGSCTDSDIQIRVITSLTCHPGTVLFDAITNSKNIHNMVSKLTPGGCMKWAELMMDLVRGKTKTDFGDFSNQNYEELVQFALTELTRSITMPGLAKQTDWHLRLLKFLFLHSFFDVKQAIGDIPMCEPRVGPAFSERSRTSIQGALHKAMDRMATYRAPGERAAKDLRPYINMLHDVTQFVQSLLASGDELEPHQELLPEMLTEWKKVLASVEEIRSKHITDDKMSEGHAFELLFISLGLQLFSQAQDAMDIIEDLHVCYKKAFIKKRRMSIKPQSEPEWVEVVTEMLLSLLSQGSHLVRFVTTTVFRMLSPHMTKPALQLVLNVLKPEDEETSLGFEDKEDKDDGEEEGSSDSGMEEEEENEDESSDEEEEEEEEEEVEVDENLRQSLKQALGKAAVDSDEDDDAASDLDDEAMFKLDDVLSQAFKSMLKNKKNSKEERERRQQLKTFKLKCLDLLNGFVSSEPPPSLSLELVFPLLNLIDRGTQDKAMIDIGRKATTVFNNLVTPRKVLSDPELDQEELPDMIQKLIDFSVRAHGVPLVLNVASACLFVIRILLGLESNSGPSPVRTRSRSALKSTPKAKDKTNAKYDRVQAIITESLQSFCLKRDTHLNHMLFHSMFDRQPSILWPQAEELLRLVQNEDVRIFCRTQVCGMLAVMVKKETVEGIGEEAWKEFSENLSHILPDMLLTKVQATDLKPRFVHELLYLLLRVCSVSQDMVTQLLTPEIIQKVNLLKTNMKKDTKAVCRKIVHLKEISRKRQNEGNQKGEVSPAKRAKITSNLVNTEPAQMNQKPLVTVSEEVAEEPEIESAKKSGKKSAKKNKGLEAEEKEHEDQILMKTPKKDLQHELLEEAEPKSSKKKKRKSTNGDFTEIRTPKTTPQDKAVESRLHGTEPEKTNKPEQSDSQSEKMNSTPKSAKKKRKSLNKLEGEVNSVSKTPAKTEAGDAAMRLVTEEDPDGVGADLEMIFTPKPKVNRRRSTRLSMIAKGTPKAGKDC